MKSKVWERIGYAPHSGQQTIHNSPARHRVVAAGRRFGKSQVGGHELTVRAFESFLNRSRLEQLGIRQEYWIVGPNYSDAEKEFRVLWDDIRRLGFPVDRPGSYYSVESGNMQLSLWNGKFIVQAKSSQHPETLVGEGLHGVIMAEAAKMKPSVWIKYIRPTLVDFHGWSLWSSTPEGKNHFYDRWRDGIDPGRSSWAGWRQPSWTNNYAYPIGVTPVQLDALKDDRQGPIIARRLGIDPEIADLYEESGSAAFAQEIECSFADFVGIVYGDFDEEIHVTDLQVDPAKPIAIATDYGYTNPSVVLFIQTDVWDNVYVLGEFYRTGLTAEELAEQLMDSPRFGPLVRQATELYPDPEDPGSTSTLATKWKLTVKGGTGGLLRTRIDLIRKWLKVENAHLPDDHIDRKPKLMFDRSCKETIREFEAYRYPDSSSFVRSAVPENPMKKDDHAPEALSRFFGGRYGASTMARRSRVSTARFT